MKKFNNKSFTLLELLVVIAVIAILAAVIMISLSDARRKATEAKGLQFSQNIHTTLGVDIVGEWTFDDETNPGKDTSGSGKNGVVKTSSTNCLYPNPAENCPEWRENGQVRGVLWFNRFSNNWISISGLSIQNEFTYSAWINTDDQEFTGSQGIVSNHSHPQPCYGTSLYLVTSSTSSRFRVGAGDGLNNRPVFNFGPNLQSKTWYYVVTTYRDGTFHFYINGEKIPATWTTTVAQNNTDFVIGRWAPTYGDYYFNGLIDEVRIYEKALTIHEIQKLYAQSKDKYFTEK